MKIVGHPLSCALPLSFQDKSSVPSWQRIKDKPIKGERALILLDPVSEYGMTKERGK